MQCRVPVRCTHARSEKGKYDKSSDFCSFGEQGLRDAVLFCSKISLHSHRSHGNREAAVHRPAGVEGSSSCGPVSPGELGVIPGDPTHSYPSSPSSNFVSTEFPVLNPFLFKIAGVLSASETEP